MSEVVRDVVGLAVKALRDHECTSFIESEIAAVLTELDRLRAERDRLEAIRRYLAEDDFPMVRKDILRALASGEESRAEEVRPCFCGGYHRGNKRCGSW